MNQIFLHIGFVVVLNIIYLSYPLEYVLWLVILRGDQESSWVFVEVVVSVGWRFIADGNFCYSLEYNVKALSILSRD